MSSRMSIEGLHIEGTVYLTIDGPRGSAIARNLSVLLMSLVQNAKWSQGLIKMTHPFTRNGKMCPFHLSKESWKHVGILVSIGPYQCFFTSNMDAVMWSSLSTHLEMSTMPILARHRELPLSQIVKDEVGASILPMDFIFAVKWFRFFLKVKKKTTTCERLKVSAVGNSPQGYNLQHLRRSYHDAGRKLQPSNPILDPCRFCFNSVVISFLIQNKPASLMKLGMASVRSRTNL